MREQRRRVYKVGSQQHSLWTGYRGKREETVLVGRWWIQTQPPEGLAGAL